MSCMVFVLLDLLMTLTVSNRNYFVAAIIVSATAPLITAFSDVPQFAMAIAQFGTLPAVYTAVRPN